MNVMCIHIDETLHEPEIHKLKQELTGLPHVVNVELNPAMPHDLTVECEARFNMPMLILDKLSHQGLHLDIQPC